MRRIYGILSIILLVSQTACYTSQNSADGGEKPTAKKPSEKTPKVNFPPLPAADFETEKAEAQKLIVAGITFENTSSAHGEMTEKGVSFGSNDFESSDGIELSRYGKLYETSGELTKAFEAEFKGAVRIFENKQFRNGGRMFVGASDKSAIIVSAEGNYLYTVSCVSLRHLLAFESKESAYFGYKTAK
jgi:hypothetical protein